MRINFTGIMTKGYSLIEIMIVIAIVGLIISIALPSYQNYILKVNRSEASSALMLATNAMERYRINNYSYRGASAGETFSVNVPLDNGRDITYRLSLQLIPSGYIITAESVGRQLSMLGETELLSIDSLGVKRWRTDRFIKRCWPGALSIC